MVFTRQTLAASLVGLQNKTFCAATFVGVEFIDALMVTSAIVDRALVLVYEVAERKASSGVGFVG